MLVGNGPCTLVTMSSKTVADVTQSVLKSIPCRLQWESNAFPRVQAREHNPLAGCWPFMYSPVVVTGAQPPSLRGLLLYSPVEVTCRSTAPFSRGGCYLLAQGACPKQFTNPFLAVYLLVVWECMHVYEVD